MAEVERTATGQTSPFRQQSTIAPTTLDASLLRAVRVSTVLRGCGASFSSQASSEKNYQKSFETTHISDFLSHDWRTSRLGKVVVLCLVYNSRAALVASTLAAGVLAASQYGPEPVLPAPKPGAGSQGSDTRGASAREFGYWCQACCPLVFTFVFLFWQDIRCLLRLGSRSCFLDKFCIDQLNVQRKAQGILGLAGFLRCSESMIVLWTPQYFSRLWCTYEVASWLHLQKPLNSVLFMPVAHARIVVTLMLACCVGFSVLILGSIFFPDYFMPVVALALLTALTGGAHQARHSTSHLRALPEQLETFAVTRAHCYCCSVGHRDTCSGDSIPCDREVVYATLAEWFSDDDGMLLGADAALGRFDRAVRKEFAPKVLAKAGPTQLSYRYVIIAGWPYIFRACDMLSAGDHLAPEFRTNATIVYATMALVTLPASYKVAMHMAICVDKQVGIPRRRWADYLLSLALGGAYTLTILLVWLPMDLLASHTAAAWPTVLVALVYSVAAMCLYHQDLRELASSAGFFAPKCSKQMSDEAIEDDDSSVRSI